MTCVSKLGLPCYRNELHLLDLKYYPVSTSEPNIASRMSFSLQRACFRYNRPAMSEDLKTAVVTGYTGAIGREVVKALAESKRFEKVVLIGRRHVEYDDENIKALVSKRSSIRV